MKTWARKPCAGSDVEDMPLVVIIDCEGNNLYESGRAAYLRKRNGK